jgi:predicted nucleic acid-binding protein
VALERAEVNSRKGLILDANILIRGVFGKRVRELLETYEDAASFYSPDVCFQDARKYVPHVSERRGLDLIAGLAVLDGIEKIVEPIDRSLYEEYEQLARERVHGRDPDDWPVVAVAMLLELPIWTEDRDFFGSGIGTWTTDRVEFYLRES